MCCFSQVVVGMGLVVDVFDWFGLFVNDLIVLLLD